MAFGEDFVEVLFHRPWRAHPPARHLINDHVGPEKFRHFFGNVVALVDKGGFHIETAAIQHAQRGFMQGGVVATVRVGEFFTAIEQQHFFHEKASAQPLGWMEKGNWNGGRLTIRLARNKA
ncbi:hypothetical protein D3C87_700130 [compost metagenome]